MTDPRRLFTSPPSGGKGWLQGAREGVTKSLSDSASRLSEKAALAVADGATRLGDTSVGKSLQMALEDPEKVRELLRGKNRQIKELEEERHDRAAELESVKVRAVAKFKALSQKNAQLEEQMLRLEASVSELQGGSGALQPQR